MTLLEPACLRPNTVAIGRMQRSSIAFGGPTTPCSSPSILNSFIREGEGRLERAVEALEQRIEDGDPDVNEHDRYRLSTTLAEVEGRRSEALRLEASSRAALLTLTGLNEVHIPECPLAPIELEHESLDSYRATAIENRPELAMVEAGLRARRAEQDVVEAQYFPDLALGINASYSVGPGITDQTNPFIIDQANYQTLGAGLVLRWSLDFVGNRMRERRVDALLREAEERAEEARAGVALEVETTVRTLEDAQRREEAWRRGHRDARSWFVAAGAAYQVGTLEPRESRRRGPDLLHRPFQSPVRHS